MPKAIDGTWVPDKLPMMPCGGKPHFNYQSGYNYICDSCLCVIGSMSQPKECKEYNEANSNN